MATIPCWVSIPMFMMTTNRLKEVSISSNHSVYHFLSHRGAQNYRNPNLWLVATIPWWLIGVSPYVFDDDTSIKSGFKFVKLFGGALFTTYCHFLSYRRAQNYRNPNFGYHVPCWVRVSIPMFLMTTNRLKVVARLLNYPVSHFTTFEATAEPNIFEIQIYVKYTLSGSQM
jgi:hypothetical protein